MRIRAKGILVLVWVVGILIAIFVATCGAHAGGDGGDIKKKVSDVAEAVQSVLEEPEQHTEQATEDEADAHGGADDHESHFSLLHFETQKMVASIIGSVALLGGSIFGGICALRAAKARRKKNQQE